MTDFYFLCSIFRRPHGHSRSDQLGNQFYPVLHDVEAVPCCLSKNIQAEAFRSLDTARTTFPAERRNRHPTDSRVAKGEVQKRTCTFPVTQVQCLWQSGECELTGVHTARAQETVKCNLLRDSTISSFRALSSCTRCFHFSLQCLTL